MNKKVSILMTLTAALLFGLAASSWGAILQVPVPYATISAAVTAAADGDIIEVADGTYTEHVTVNKELTIRAAAGSSPIVDGGGSGSCFNIYKGAG